MTTLAPRRLFARGTTAGDPSRDRPDAAEPAFDPAGPGRAAPGSGVPGQGASAATGTDAPAPSGVARPEWADIVREHSPRVFRLAYRLTGNRHDAEDLTQDVFVRVFRSLDRFEPGNFEAWLHRITTNLFLDGARRRQRIRFDALADDADGRLPDRSAGTSERFEMTHLDGEVRDALLALRPEFRAAVVLCDIEGLPYEEVADVLGVKLGTVRSRIHRGRTQLRERLAHRAPGVRPAADDRTPVVPAGDPVTVRPRVLRGV